MAALALAVLAGFGVGLVLPASAFAETPRQDNPHGKFKEECSLCHSPAGWSRVKLSQRFDHARYGMPLEGAHRTRECTSCHLSLDFSASPAQCVTCHQDPHRGEQGTDCGHCHNTRNFTDRGPMLRAHQLSSFPLTGSHAVADCNSCHKPAAQGQLQYSATPTDCVSCHAETFRSTRSPDHVAAGFPTDCKSCHQTQAWATATFDHAKTAFPLTGAHLGAQCRQCHATGTFTAMNTACASCHAQTYAAAQPPHTEASFPTAQCATCHNTSGWTRSFDHSTTAFPLTGAHAGVACASCHADGVYAGRSTGCYSCHANTYASATPPHSAGSFPTGACATCHRTSAWRTTFDHSTTTFPLTGSHLTLATCVGCHGDGVYAGRSTDCYSCHRNSTPGYATATNPVHTPASFPTTTASCTGCHNTTAWRPAAFTHPATFPLTSAHAGRLCEDCHKGNYATLVNNCYSCHQNSTPGYATTTNPAHTAPSFGTTNAACLRCHNTVAWQPATFTHPATFPLRNAHAGRACSDCHGDGVYAGKSVECYSCHRNSTPGYATTTNPPHTPANFPTDNPSCTGCHNTIAFSPSAFPANHSTTAFAATFNGAHLAAACTDCHNAATWNVQGTGNNCYGCHATDYANTSNPRHDTASFPVAGCACHNTRAWSPATGGFDHAGAGFPLTGNHALTVRACSDCHAASGYGAGATSMDCYSCHATSTPGYANPGPNAPVHNAQYFPAAQCTTCHAAAAANHVTWQGGTLTHPATFPLSNAHAGRQCQDCHKGNYTSLANNCYSCHLNSTPGYATTTNPPHTPVNFPTTNAACTGCHTTIAFSPSTFPANHSTTAFAGTFTGAHRALACTQCHNAATWNVQATSNNCYGCHAADYAGTTNPRHDTTNFPVAGCTCHSTTAWAGATAFDHASVGFAMTGSHSLAARQCSDCHNIIGYTANASALECYTCHTADYASNGIVKHSSPNFPTAKAQCIACHTAANASHLTWQGGAFTNHAGVTTNFALSGNHGGFQCADCHTSAATDLKQWTCSVSCHSGSNDFGPNGSRHSQNASRAGYTFSVVVRVETIKACYSCHPSGRAG